MSSRVIEGAVFGLALVGSIAAFAIVGSRAASTAAGTTYTPMQAISHDVGSKSAVGYFVREAGICQLVLMIAEKSDAGDLPVPSVARLRLVLEPGEVAGLDSEEGQSIDLTCDDYAATLTVVSRRTDDLAILTN
jgi:hypothetical protein